MSSRRTFAVKMEKSQRYIQPSISMLLDDSEGEVAPVFKDLFMISGYSLMHNCQPESRQKVKAQMIGLIDEWIEMSIAQEAFESGDN